MYDVANWKPITHKVFCEELGNATLTGDDPNELKLIVEDLGDGRVRTVVHALCNLSDGRGIQQHPYLMMIHSTEDGGTVCFLSDESLSIHDGPDSIYAKAAKTA